MRVGRVDQSLEYVDVKLNQQQVQPQTQPADGTLKKLQREVEQQVQEV